MRAMRNPQLLAPVFGAFLLGACASPKPQSDAKPATTKTAEKAPAPNKDPQNTFLARAKHPSPTVWVAGQPRLADLEAAAAAGVSVVVNMRGQGEPTGFADEKATVEAQGMSYVFIPVAGAAGITDANAAQLKAVLKDAGDKKVLLHCASGNRVGALLALIAFADGKSVSEAMAIGTGAGMTGLTPMVKGKLDAAAAKRK